MRRIILITSILTVLSQVVFSQNLNENNVKSIYLKINKSEAFVRKNEAGDFLKSQLNIPNGYEFKNITTQRANSAESKSKSGYIHERYEQYYKGIKVEYSDIRVHYAPDSRALIHGDYINVSFIDTAIILSEVDAIKKAKAYIGAETYMWEDHAENNWFRNSTEDFYPKCETVICYNSLDTKERRLHVAYKINITASKPFSSDYVYVNVKTGDILASASMIMRANGIAETQYSGTQTIASQKLGSVTYRLVDEDRKIETYNRFKEVYFINNNPNWTSNDWADFAQHQVALDAHWGTMMTYDYFKNILGRNGYDDNNGTIYNYVHQSFDGASYMGGRIGYGDGIVGNSWTSLDVVAHEFSHGIWANSVSNEFTSPPMQQKDVSGTGRVATGETGFINEGLSDIWGACVKNYVNRTYGLTKNLWLGAEEVYAQTSYSCERNMQNPKDNLSFGGPCPNMYRGEHWRYVSDFTEPHTNSTVLSHWFYLLCNGGSGRNDDGNVYHVAPIDVNINNAIDKAAEIVYLAENKYLTKNTNYYYTRLATIEAARELLYDDNSPEMASIVDAWYAVGFECVPVGLNPVPTAPITTPTVTWQGDKHLVNTSIRVARGGVLTITGTVYFTGEGTIIVERGGKLVIDGGTLKSACGDFWKGIEVRGLVYNWAVDNKLLMQTASEQGMLVLKNNAKIERAKCGIFVGETVNDNQNNSGGGIVYADNAHFINNQQAVYFKPYSDVYNGRLIDNVSYFNGCTFSLNDATSLPITSAQVYLHTVNNIRFMSCTFTDSRTKTTKNDYIYGIEANNSRITVGISKSDYAPHRKAPCYFSGFKQAIRITGSEYNSSRIFYCEFTDNHIGIFANRVSDLRIESCLFQIPSLPFNIFEGDDIGIQIGENSNVTSTYNIANNQFFGQNAGIGVVTKNTGTANNLIKNNTFSDLCNACKAIGVNGYRGINGECGGGNSSEGLVYQCNKFENNGTDITVAEDSRIRHLQSGEYITSATGNTFSGSNINISYNERDCDIKYQWLSSNPSLHEPSLISGITGNVLPQGVPGNRCIFNGYAGDYYYMVGWAEDYHTIPEMEARYSELEDIDDGTGGGSGTGTGNPIINWKEAAVMEIVARLEMSDDFTITINGAPPTNDLEAQIVSYYWRTNIKQQMDAVCYAALDILAKDEEGLDIEQYRHWIRRFNTVESEYLLAESYISMKEFDQAEAVLSEMPFKFEGMNLETHHNYLDYFAVVREIHLLNPNDNDVLPPHFFAEVADYFREKNTIPSFLLDKLLYSFEERDDLIENLTNTFIDNQEFYPLWYQQAKQYLAEKQLPDNLITELADYITEDFANERIPFFINDKAFYSYWQNQLYQYFEEQGMPQHEIDSKIIYYQTAPFTPLFVNTLVNYFTINGNLHIWRDILVDYLTINERFPVSLSGEFVQYMEMNNQLPVSLLQELVIYAGEKKELSPLLYALVEMNAPLDWLYDEIYTIGTNQTDLTSFLQDLLSYAEANNDFPVNLLEDIYHSSGITVIPSSSIHELVRLSANDDIVAIKAYSFGEILIANWRELYPREFEEHTACVCSDETYRGDNQSNSNPLQKSADKEQQEELIQEVSTWKVYPNPTTGQLQIAGYELQENVEYSIYSIVGQVVLQGKLQNNTINVESLAKGMYYLKIDGKTVKFVKE